MDEKNKRELLPDILRGFAIILVVFGHCIQEGSGETYRIDSLYFKDRLYQFIYSFHMPLFMIVSGYLSWGSINKAEKNGHKKELLIKRASSLLTPIFLWTAVDYARILITNYIKGEPQPQALIFVYFYNALNNLWFLWAVWWCFLIVYIMHFYMKDNIVIYLLGFFVLFITPDGLCMGVYKFMMPYFIVAYYMHGYLCNKGKKFYEKPKLSVIVSIGVIFLGLFLFYNEESLIYLTGYKLIGKNILKQLGIDFFRMAIGFLGSIFFILLWQYIVKCVNRPEYKFKILTMLGTNSMGIYILSGYLLVFVVQKIDFIDKNSYFMNIIEMIVVLVISLFITIVMSRIPIIKKFVGK